MSPFAQSLKTWRSARRFSQLDLAMKAEISARHLSFLETGRAQPSRGMIARLSEALQLPLDARNHLLASAGFAARYPRRQWDSGEMAPIRKSIELMLSRHDPFPGLAADRLWTVRQMNGAAARLFAPIGIGVGDSLLDLMMSEHIPNAIENWPVVARHAAARLRTESIAQGSVSELDRVADHLSRVAGGTDTSPGPVVPIIFRLGAERLAMFATIAQFGTPEDVTLDAFKIELYFPMDEAAERLLREMAMS